MNARGRAKPDLSPTQLSMCGVFLVWFLCVPCAVTEAELWFKSPEPYLNLNMISKFQFEPNKNPLELTGPIRFRPLKRTGSFTQKKVYLQISKLHIVCASNVKHMTLTSDLIILPVRAAVGHNVYSIHI